MIVQCFSQDKPDVLTDKVNKIVLSVADDKRTQSIDIEELMHIVQAKT